MRRLSGPTATIVAAIFAFTSNSTTTTAQVRNTAPTAVGAKLADGQAYVTLVRVQHQPDSSQNGRILIAFEENGMAGIPLYESKDEGASWQLVVRATDATHTDHDKCNLHWQPHLTEMPRTVGSLKAGTLLLSASAVCNNDKGRMAEQQLQLYSSADLGRSWEYRGAIDNGTAEAPVWEPNLQVLDDGTLVTYYSSEKHKLDGFNQLLSHKVSRDQGKTWGEEVYDVAFPGGVERPGMAIVDRLPDQRYVLSYEDVEGPVQNQVYLKYSRDGLNWGNPAERGTPVQTDGGAYPINCPVVRRFPVGGPDGVLIVSARGASGGGDPGGRSLFWNANNGVGPWWEMPAPVQKLMNGRSGWTQALLLKSDGSLLHITSSANAAALENPMKNEILFASAVLDLNRYEAEDAARQGSALMRDRSMSNGAKVRLGAKDIGRLTFHVHLAKEGDYKLAVNYEDIGLAATPRLAANGADLTGTVNASPHDEGTATVRNRDLGTRGKGDKMTFASSAHLQSGDNTIQIAGGAYALDIDYLEVTRVEH